MAKRKNVNDRAETLSPELSAGSDLSLRLEKISEQTGLSPQSLLQKWILQEETLIGLMQRNKEPIASQSSPKDTAEALPKLPRKPAARKKAPEPAPLDQGNPDYRKMLVEKIKELKNDGMSLKKIAAIFNEEKTPTVSGTGKWYASSVTNLLKSKK